MATERKFENREMQKRYDESRPKEGGDKKMGGDKTPDGDEKGIEDVVSEHGPADSVEVHSHHGKHTHKSKHSTPDEAKEQIDKAFGEAPAEQGMEAEPEPGGAAPAMGGGMPTMK